MRTSAPCRAFFVRRYSGGHHAGDLFDVLAMRPAIRPRGEDARGFHGETLPDRRCPTVGWLPARWDQRGGIPSVSARRVAATARPRLTRRSLRTSAAAD